MRVGVIMYQTSLTKGQELVAQRMVKEFRRQGHEAYLVTSVYHDQAEVVSADEVGRRGGHLHSFDESLGIPVVRVKSHKENWPPRRIAFEDFVSTLTRIVDDLKLDVLVTHSTLWNGPEETAKFVEWRRKQAAGGAPVSPMVFCHMSHFQEPSEERYDLAERTFREAWNGASLPGIMRAADLVLVTTPYEREQMKEIGVEGSKILLFPGGIDSFALDASRGDIRGRYGIPHGPKLATYLGTVEDRKNAKAILKVARLLEWRTDVHFVIAGRLEGAYGQEVKAESVGRINVTVTGPVPEEDIPSLISESWLNVNLSRSEALGLSQLEFMYNGVPVVTSGVGGQSWIVKDGSSGVVLEGPDDIVGAADAVSELSSNVKKRNKLGARSREIASQFTMPKLVWELTDSVSAKLGGGAPVHDFEPGEQLIEAWVKRGYKVALTTRRLIVDSAKGGNPASIPLFEITRLRRRWKLPLKALLAGTVASAALYFSEVFQAPQVAAAWGWLYALADGMRPGASLIVALLLAAIPLLAALATAKLVAFRGYAVEFGRGKVAFIPAEFERALRKADELTARTLYSAEPFRWQDPP